MNARRIFHSLPIAILGLLVTSPSYSEAVYSVLRSTRPLTESTGSFDLPLRPFNPALGKARSLVLKFELEINEVKFSVAAFCNDYNETHPGHGAEQLLFEATTTLHVSRVSSYVSSFDRYGDFTYRKLVYCPAGPPPPGRPETLPVNQSNDLPIVIEIPILSVSDTGYDTVYVSWAPLLYSQQGTSYSATFKGSADYYYDDTIFADAFD